MRLVTITIIQLQDTPHPPPTWSPDYLRSRHHLRLLGPSPTPPERGDAEYAVPPLRAGGPVPVPSEAALVPALGHAPAGVRGLPRADGPRAGSGGRRGLLCWNLGVLGFCGGVLVLRCRGYRLGILGGGGRRRVLYFSTLDLRFGGLQLFRFRVSFDDGRDDVLDLNLGLGLGDRGRWWRRKFQGRRALLYVGELLQRLGPFLDGFALQLLDDPITSRRVSYMGEASISES